MMVSSVNHDLITFFTRGNKGRGIFFGVLGLLFEIIFGFIWFSVASSDPELSFLFFTLLNSEMVPFLFIAFTFGGGCLLVALKEFGWEESIHVKRAFFDGKPGIRKISKLFFWSRNFDIQTSQIIVLRLHSVLLDRIGMNKVHLIEIDYRLSSDSHLETLILYKDNIDRHFEPASTLVVKIHDILALSGDIEKTESSQ